MTSDSPFHGNALSSQQHLRQVFGAGPSEQHAGEAATSDHRKASKHSAASTLATTFGLLTGSFRDKRKAAKEKAKKKKSRKDSESPARKTDGQSNSVSNFIIKSSTSVSESFRDLTRRASQISLFRDTSPEIETSDDDNDENVEALLVLNPVRLVGADPETRLVLNMELVEEIRTILPHRVKLYDTWQLVYSLEQHGSSLNTLYKSCEPPWEQTPSIYGYVLVVKDSSSGIFGAYLNEPLHVQASKRFYGNGDCFLWKYNALKRDTNLLNLSEFNNDSIHNNNTTTLASKPDRSKAPRFQAFLYTSLNHYIIFSQREYLALGSSGGHYSLWLDANLENGASQQTDTFGNEPLSSEGPTFKVLAVEVWRIGNHVG